MNRGSHFSNKKYAGMIALPILFDLIVSKGLELAVFEYDIAFLLLALSLSFIILLLIIAKAIKYRFTSINYLDLLTLVIVIYNFLIIFGIAPSFAELLNI